MTRTHDHSTDARPEHVMLDLGPGVGALVLRTAANLHGKEIDGAVFEQLPAGDYTLWLDDQPLRRHVAVAGEAVTDISLKEAHA